MPRHLDNVDLWFTMYYKSQRTDLDDAARLRLRVAYTRLLDWDEYKEEFFKFGNTSLPTPE